MNVQQVGVEFPQFALFIILFVLPSHASERHGLLDKQAPEFSYSEFSDCVIALG